MTLNYNVTRRLGRIVTAALVLTGVSAFSLVGCMFKKSLATQESVMTGSGEHARYLVPVPVEESDGAVGYCVYVAGPETDPTSLAPGQTEGSYVLTSQSITQDDFFTGLKELKGVGGWGNTIMTDVLASSTVGVVTAGLAAEGTKLAMWSKLSESGTAIVDTQLDRLSTTAGKARVADMILDGRVVDNSRAIRQSLIKSGMSLEDANLIQNALLNAPSETVARAQNGLEFARGALARSSASLPAKAQAISAIAESAPILNGEIGPATSLADLMDNIFKARRNQVEIAGGLGKIQQMVSKLANAARRSESEVIKVVNSGIDDSVLKNIDGLLGTSPMVAQEGIEGLGSAVSKRTSTFTRAVIAQGDNATAAVGASAQVRQVVTRTFDSVNIGLAKGARNMRNVCVGPGGDWKLKAGRLLLCGLAAGTATWGVKKLAWEPATAGVKLAQVSEAMGDSESFHKVNAKTFEAIAAGIGSFEASSFGKPCQ